MNNDLDIEPDELPVLRAEIAEGVSLEHAAGRYLPADFPLTTLLRFMPDVKMKQRVQKAAQKITSILDLDHLIDSVVHEVTESFGCVEASISQARRAWVTPADVLNTRSRADLLTWLATPKPRVPSRP